MAHGDVELTLVCRGPGSEGIFSTEMRAVDRAGTRAHTRPRSSSRVELGDADAETVPLHGGADRRVEHLMDFRFPHHLGGTGEQAQGVCTTGRGPPRGLCPRAASSHGLPIRRPRTEQAPGRPGLAGGGGHWSLTAALGPLSPLHPGSVLHFLPNPQRLALAPPGLPPRPALLARPAASKVQDKHGCPDPTGPCPSASRRAAVPPLPAQTRPLPACGLRRARPSPHSLVQRAPGPLRAGRCSGAWGQGQLCPQAASRNSTTGTR